MHSINLKVITEQIFCLVNMSFITKFVIFNLKTGKQFSLAKGSVEAGKVEIPIPIFVGTILFN